MVVVPGTEGNFGVLPGPFSADFDSPAWRHRRLLGQRNQRSASSSSGGFAEVTPERCTVLADEAVPLSSLDGRRGRDQPAAKLDAAVAALRERTGRAHR